MIHKVPYKKFNFRKPDELDVHDYYGYKRILRNNDRISITPKFNYKETFENEIGLLKFIFYTFLSSFVLKIMYKISDVNFLRDLHVIPFLLGGLLFGFSWLSFLPTIISFWDYKTDEKKYFNQLKKDILLSNSYPEFLIIRDGRN
ncbi:MAG: hypothetical protein ACKOX3_02095 [Bacteroidota bacterium]